jgi:hypothetical protein
VTPFLVSHWSVDAVFPKAAPILAKALGTHTAWTVAELATLCSNRGAWLFVDDMEHPKDALVGRFEVWGGQQVFNILVMGGKGEDWPTAMDTIKDFVSTFGVNRIRWDGRIGWQRVFKDARVIYQAYQIEIED